jgi:outer membrane immunogenic protein
MMMTRLTILAATTIALLAAVPALAADLPAKARPLPPAPSWTGFYIGGQVGGGWGNRTVGYTGDDPASTTFINGTVPFPGNQPVFPHSFGVSGVTGGIEAGYNWQVSPNWVVGVEADFSGSDIKGSGSSTSVLAAVAPAPFTQTVSADQKIEWWGTVRGRLGWLATRDLLLFGTAGFAYGKTSTSDSYLFSGSGGTFGVTIPGSSFNCTAINTTCFAGTNSTVQTGWTAGGGAEWRWSSNWTVKAEYLYVNLGRGSVRAVANTLGLPGFALSSYTANFGRTDFHTVRLGLNYHF